MMIRFRVDWTRLVVGSVDVLDGRRVNSSLFIGQVNDATSSVNNSGEQLSKRCVALLKMALKPDVWPHCELKLAWFDRLFQTADNSSASVSVPAGTAASGPNFTNICTALDLLTFLLNILRKEQILAGFKPLQRGLSTLMSCNNSKVLSST